MTKLIFGYTWAEIERAQQDGVLRQILPLQAQMAKDDICSNDDLKLLEEHGIDGLIEKQFHGVLDRLQRAGVYDPHSGKECLGPGCIYCDESEAI